MITLTHTSYTTIPGHITWCIPASEHTEDMPFCGKLDCMCHYDSDRIERYMVRPIERGELTIPEALDRYYNRQRVEVSA